jgi:phosphoribosylaminoimidazole-succinocarboxamide synthase
MLPLYEGKAKKVYATENPDEIIIEYKDDATAFNGEKKGSILNKGVVNNAISSIIYTLLKQRNIPTHFIKKLSDREQLCKKVKIIPLEVIVRNIAAGSMSKRLGIEEGRELKNTVYEICYKDDSLGDPLINDTHALALGIVDRNELDIIYRLTQQINGVLMELFLKANIILVDFKLEFGKYKDQILLADEISPDTCRFWDKNTLEKLDKDRFRRDLGSVEEAYREMLNRVSSIDQNV